MRVILKILGFLIVVLIITIATTYTVTKIKNKILFKQVDALALSEFNLINLPDELPDEQEKYSSSFGCDYSYKIGATRCNTRYTKYYVKKADLTDEIWKVNEYLAGLGWRHEYTYGDNKESSARLAKEGFLPFSGLEKNSVYPLELHVKFYGPKDRSTFNSEHDKKINSLLDRYSDKNTAIYSISISTDIIDR